MLREDCHGASSSKSVKIEYGETCPIRKEKWIIHADHRRSHSIHTDKHCKYSDHVRHLIGCCVIDFFSWSVSSKGKKRAASLMEKPLENQLVTHRQYYRF